MSANRLGDATSPYLLQHAGNPVDWWEWGPEALAAAARRDVPVLLSVGYASCHWCHVMAHESFEDADIAAVMNAGFVNIKVDREERPDVDRVYMDAVQAMTGSGGWPMTVFLTPSGAPFYAGTYFPPDDRHGHPSFRRVLAAVSDAWENRRSEVEQQAGTLVQAVAAPIAPGSDSAPGKGALSSALESIASAFDPSHGGFGGAPKFPQAPTLEFLLRSAAVSQDPQAEQMVVATLLAMADGGIHDLIGGGFSRYSVDDRWLVPHFEKMLYDNALLASLYARAWQVTGVSRMAEVAESTIDYMLRDLWLDEGGFASGEDADSEGEEGRFYVFTLQEVVAATPHDAEAVLEILGVTPEGNFEGKNIVHRAVAPEEVAAAKGLDPLRLRAAVDATLERLGAVRAARIRPGLDDKVVTAWNGLAVKALAEAGLALGRDDYLDHAAAAAEFLWDNLRSSTGRLMRSWRDGRTSVPGFCDDYAALAVALFELYRVTGSPDWYHRAATTTGDMVDLFWDTEAGGFFATGHDAERLIARPKNLFDNPTPSDNSLAAEALQHMVALSGDRDSAAMLGEVFGMGSSLLDRYPLGGGHLLAVLAVQLSPPLEVALVGQTSSRAGLEEAVREIYRPAVFVALGDGDDDHDIPLLRDRLPGAAASAYVCRGFVCDAPVGTASELRSLLAPAP